MHLVQHYRARWAYAWETAQSHYLVQWTRIWEATQVELHGHYTIANVQAFENYHATASWLRALLVCALTPVPCLVVIVGVDLLPLEPPTRGPSQSLHVWIRTLVTVTLITYCILLQFRSHLPQLKLTRWLMTAISVAASTSSVAFCYAMAHAIGYPLPFHMIVGMPAWSSAVVAMVVLFRGHTLVTHRRLPRRVGRYLLVFGGQMMMTVIYPVFNYVYSTLSSTQQTGAILILPVIKIIAKNWISHTLPDTDDAKPEAIVFNVEIFHSLFVSICMGSTSSPRTVVALMAIDLIQAWLSFGDVQGLVTDLAPIATKLARARRRTRRGDALSTRGLWRLTTLCSRVIEAEPLKVRRPRLCQSPTNVHASRVTTIPMARMAPTASFVKMVFTVAKQGTLRAFGRRLKSVVLAPEPRPLPRDLATLNIVERGVLVTQTQQVLFITEFIVLIEYTEVIMPMIYTIYVVATWHLPNRAYYPNLNGIDSVQDLRPTIANIQLYASLEFVSLITIACVMWWKLRLSLLHQLAFVLEKRFANVQAKLLLWVLYTMQTSIVQLGVDYSFHFAWLHSPSSSIDSPQSTTARAP